ncbi:hypothetical protein LguiA_029720 [Lonicera macranthoides]
MSVIHLELNVLRKNYGNNPIVVIPRISAFETNAESMCLGDIIGRPSEQSWQDGGRLVIKWWCKPGQGDWLTWNSLFLVVFNADSVLGTDSRTSMNSQVTKPGNIAEDSSIISAREHFKTSHGYFIHPQGSKELVGSLETKWKTTNQYLLKEHAWLQCTRRCMFALVPQLNNLLMKLLQNLIINILSFGQCRTSIENTPTTDTGLLSNLHVFLLVHNSHPPPCRLNCLRQQKLENLGDTPSRSHKQVGQAILPIVACWQSNISSCDAEFPTATHIGKIDINLLG